VAELVLDSMVDAAPWVAVGPDGATPSDAIACAVDTSVYHLGEDRSSLRIVGTTGAAQHRLIRTIAAVDLRPFDELRLAIRGDRVAGMRGGQPFYLELRLSSAVAPPDSVTNPWYRLLPVPGDSWTVVRLSLTDLPDAVRSAVERVQLRCVDARSGFRILLDDLLAVRHEPSVDADAGLIRRLHNRLQLNGQRVPAQVQVAGDALPPGRPLILLHPYTARFAEQRRVGGESEGDYRTDGYSLRPVATPWDLYYAVEALAADRASQAALIDFVLGALPPRGTLPVCGFALPCDNVAPGEAVAGTGFPTRRLLLHYRVATWQESGQPRPVRPAETVRVEIDAREVADA